jgi:uncharacterized protein (TIGR01777 family)
MHFLIAGSSGFLGTRLRERLTVLGHDVTALVRRPPGTGEVRWDPYRAGLGPDVVDSVDVVVNLAGSPNIGNPYSARFRERLRDSRVTTTRVLAEAIAQGDRKPTFLAQNGISFYGDRGATPLPEDAGSQGEGFMTAVTRDWQQAAAAAAESGARVCVLRTAPLLDRRSAPLKQLRLLFGAGLGGPLGAGEQHMPMISTRDWVDAVVHLSTHEDVSGPVNLSCEHTPTNREFTAELGRQVHRPAVVRVPSFVIRTGMGPLAHLPLDSVNSVPAALLASGFAFSDPDVAAVLREGLNPSR